MPGPRRFAARYYEHFPPVNTCNCYIFRRIFRTAIDINERMFGLKRIRILSQLHYLQSKSEHRSFVIFRRNTDEQYAMNVFNYTQLTLIFTSLINFTKRFERVKRNSDSLRKEFTLKIRMKCTSSALKLHKLLVGMLGEQEKLVSHSP